MCDELDRFVMSACDLLIPRPFTSHPAPVFYTVKCYHKLTKLKQNSKLSLLLLPRALSMTLSLSTSAQSCLVFRRCEFVCMTAVGSRVVRTVWERVTLTVAGATSSASKSNQLFPPSFTIFRRRVISSFYVVTSCVQVHGERQV